MGGTNSNTLAEVPDNIKNMITTQYKKFAYINMNNKPCQIGEFITFNLNIDFEPTSIFLWFSHGESLVYSNYFKTNGYLHSTDNLVIGSLDYYGSGEVIMYLDNQVDDNFMYISDIIAIE